MRMGGHACNTSRWRGRGPEGFPETNVGVFPMVGADGPGYLFAFAGGALRIGMGEGEISDEIDVLFVEDGETDARLAVRELERAGLTPSWERVDTQQALDEA